MAHTVLTQAVYVGMVSAVGKVRGLDRLGAHHELSPPPIDPINAANSFPILIVTNGNVFGHHVRVRNGPNVGVSPKFAVLTVQALPHNAKRGRFASGRSVGRRKIGPNEPR